MLMYLVVIWVLLGFSAAVTYAVHKGSKINWLGCLYLGITYGPIAWILFVRYLKHMKEESIEINEPQDFQQEVIDYSIPVTNTSPAPKPIHMISGKAFMFRSNVKQGSTFSNADFELHFPYQSYWTVISLDEWDHVINIEKFIIELAKTYWGRWILKRAKIKIMHSLPEQRYVK